MSLVGLGLDQTELDRVRRVLERYGDRFLHRCYTEGEIAFSFAHRDPVPRLSARYAAKEAGSKALGTGIARGVSWKEIEVVREEGHPPRLRFHGRALERARALGMRRVHLSLTHSRDLAAAVVILED